MRIWLDAAVCFSFCKVKDLLTAVAFGQQVNISDSCRVKRASLDVQRQNKSRQRKVSTKTV